MIFAMVHLQAGIVPSRQGRGDDSIPTYRPFPAGDGVEIVITANTEKMWTALCSVLGLEDLTDDPRIRTNVVHFENRQAL